MEVIRCNNLTSMADDGARFISDISQREIRSKGWWSLALCGGTTPRHVYERLSRLDYAHALAWSATHVFWGDERCVPPTDAASNYCTAWELLLSRVVIPVENLHRIRGECPLPEDEARRYEEEMRDFFSARAGSIVGGFPVFDLIVLGLGRDGHTASLFP
ncbi:MAG: 6-phosphogluconolactonase, partial [Desulfobacterota bacterium]|nr:6-phosphogluconolactonase [Thermodesulfobacteriota bacterium]